LAVIPDGYIQTMVNLRFGYIGITSKSFRSGPEVLSLSPMPTLLEC